jgi:hypothetical protein
MDAMGYRRPPVTVSFDDLGQRGLPRGLFVNGNLPEGITVCDVNAFAAMIKEAQAGGSLRYVRPDEYGNDQCVGLGGTSIWDWLVVRAGKPVNGERYASPHQGICRILCAPEKDGKRVCTVDLNGYPGYEPEDDSLITFTIRTRPVSLVSLERGAAARNPADVAEAVDMALSWLANTAPAAAGLLRLLAFLPPEPIPLQGLLYAEQRGASLPGPEAAAVIGPLLGNPGRGQRSYHRAAHPLAAQPGRGVAGAGAPAGAGSHPRPAHGGRVRPLAAGRRGSGRGSGTCRPASTRVVADLRPTAATRPGHPEPDQRLHGADRPVPQ